MKLTYDIFCRLCSRKRLSIWLSVTRSATQERSDWIYISVVSQKHQPLCVGQSIVILGMLDTLDIDCLFVLAYLPDLFLEVVLQVPDTRDSRCKAVYYDKELPSTSVIIIFTNEAWSVSPSLSSTLTSLFYSKSFSS